MRRVPLFLVICALVVTGAVALSQEDKLTKAVNELANQLAFANEGYIRSVSGDTVYIDLGQDSGICVGMRFEVVRLGEPIVSEGVIIGHQEEIIGEIEITRVRAQMSIASIINKSKGIVEGDKVYQLTKQISRIAITEFPYGERFNDLSQDIEDRLYTAMIQRGMQIVERERLAEILAEQAMEWTGLFDLSSAAELGKLLGVEGVLIGSITDQGETLAIRARLVDVETAQSITAAASSINKTPSITEALSSGVRRKPLVTQRGEEEVGELKMPEGQLVFFDDFNTKPSDEWDLSHGTWTVTNGRFTALETKSAQTYYSVIDVGKLESYRIEVDVYLGSGRPYAGIYARKIGDTSEGIELWLLGRSSTSRETESCMWQLKTSQETQQITAVFSRVKSPIHLTVEVLGSLYIAYVNGTEVSRLFDPIHQEVLAEKSRLGLAIYYKGGSPSSEGRTTFDNFRIEEIP